MTHKSIILYFSGAFLALVACTMISSCSSTTTTPPTTTQSKVTPKAGSTFTYTKHEKDSSSGKPAVTSDSIVVATVVSSGIFYHGKDSVVTLYDDFDTLRYRVESNNDVSVYKPTFGSNGYTFNNPTPWLTLSFGAKNPDAQLFSYDTTITVQGQSEKLVVTGTAHYIGIDEIDTGASHTKLASGNQANIVISIMGTTPLTVNISSTQTYSFDFYTTGCYFHSISNTLFPDVKFIGTTVVPGSTTLTEKFLTSFNLK